MRKPAFELLEEGLKHENEGTRQVCARALLLEKQSKESDKQKLPGQLKQGLRRRKPKFRISEISHQRPPRNVHRYGKRNPPHSSRFNR